jgi:hypothetical protein
VPTDSTQVFATQRHVAIVDVDIVARLAVADPLPEIKTRNRKAPAAANRRKQGSAICSELCDALVQPHPARRRHVDDATGTRFVGKSEA